MHSCDFFMIELAAEAKTSAHSLWKGRLVLFFAKKVILLTENSLFPHHYYFLPLMH